MALENNMPATVGNAFRINDQNLVRYPLTLVVHDEMFIPWTAEGQKRFGGQFPYSYLGTSAWIGGRTNRRTLDYDEPRIQRLLRAVFSYGEYGVIVIAVSDASMARPGFSLLCTQLKERFPSAEVFVLHCRDQEPGEQKAEFARRRSFTLCSYPDQKAAFALLDVLKEKVACMQAPAYYDHMNRERAEWINLSLSEPVDAPEHRVLLVGDSISRGYGQNVSRLLPAWHVDSLNVSEGTHHPGFYYLLQQALEENRYRVLHINNGIHVHGVTPEQYRQNLIFLFQWIHMVAPGTTVVFAATTPAAGRDQQPCESSSFRLGDRDPEVQSRNRETVFHYSPENSGLYRELNRIALEVCRSFDIRFNDLFTLSVTRNLPHADRVHYQAEGYQVIAEAVADSILQAAGEKKL